MSSHTGAIVLAAGKGTRLKSRQSKVLNPLAHRPMIDYTLDLIRAVGITPAETILVVGFGKDRLRQHTGSDYRYAVQSRQQGTADAVRTALAALPPEWDECLILQADDSAFYPPAEIKRLWADHRRMRADLSFLTVEKADPGGLGRIIRDRYGRLIRIVEERNATAKEKKVKEINAAVYIATVPFLRRTLPAIRRNPATGEYHLPDMINLGLEKHDRILPIKLSDNDYFQGVNTPAELAHADRLMRRKTDDDR